MKKLFPGLPTDLASLAPDELTQLLASYQETARKLGERDPETMGDLTMAQVLEQFQAGVEEIEKIREEIQARGEVDQEFEVKLAEMSERAGVEVKAEEVVAEEEPEPTEPTEPEPAEPAEPEVVAEEVAEPVLEPVAASARMERKPLPRPTQEHKPLPAEDNTPGFTASAGVPNVEAGTVLDRLSLAKAIQIKREQTTSVAKGTQEKVVVASAQYAEAWPEERRLYGNADDQAKVDAVVNPLALVASGGLCAPVSNYYEIRNFSSAARPVRDALAGFNAVRGGLKFTQGITLASIDTAGADAGVGVKTAAQDALGGTNAVKSCQIVACPEFDEVELDMIYRCLQFGNLNSRAWPEMVAAFVDAAQAAHASLAETRLLDLMAAQSTPATTTGPYGAFSSVLYAVLRAAAGMRSRHRLGQDVVLRAILPGWAADILIADLVNSQFYRFDKTREGVVTALRELANVQASFTLDGTTTGGQVFGAQSAGPLLDFPDTMQWFLYPEGSFLFLDGGQLDLGIVRDSVLNNTNDYQMFAETFETLAFIGIESLQITSTICPSGTTGPTATAITC